VQVKGSFGGIDRGCGRCSVSGLVICLPEAENSRAVGGTVFDILVDSREQKHLFGTQVFLA